MPGCLRHSPSLPWSLVAAVAVVGCGTSARYAYAPETPAVLEEGELASTYPLPPERPEGEVRIASFGLAQLRVDAQTRVDALHVRMVVDNQGDPRAWRVDPQQQLVVFPDEGRTRPMLVNSDAAQLPEVMVPPRARRTVDLYFPVPGSIRDERDLTDFEVLWRVQTATRVVSQRTRFSRIDITPPVRDVGVSVGYGFWWYDPFYTSVRFVHPPIRVIRERPQRVIVDRHGRRGYRGR